MDENRNQFRNELERLINCYSAENGSGTPDFILAAYMDDCLQAFDKAVSRRTEWYKPAKKPAHDDDEDDEPMDDATRYTLGSM